MDLSINAVSLQGKIAQQKKEGASNTTNGSNPAIVFRQGPPPPGGISTSNSPAGQRRNIDLGLASQLNPSAKQNNLGRKVSVKNMDFSSISLQYGGAQKDFDAGNNTSALVSQKMKGVGGSSSNLLRQTSQKKVNINNIDASMLPEPGDLSATGNRVGLDLVRKPTLTKGRDGAGAGGMSQVNIALGDDFVGSAPDILNSPNNTISRTRTLPPLDADTQSRASNINLAVDLDMEIPNPLSASASNLAGTHRRAGSLRPLTDVSVDAISLSNTYIDQSGMGILKATTSQQPRPKAATDLKRPEEAAAGSGTGLSTTGLGGGTTPKPKNPVPPQPPKKQNSGGTLTATGSAMTATGSLPAPTTSPSPNQIRRNITPSPFPGNQNRIIPSIPPTTPATAAPKKPTEELKVVEELPILSARELARKRAEEKNIWRYSKMDEKKMAIYFQNKLRAKELAERTRQEFLKKLRKSSEEEEEVIEPYVPKGREPKSPVKRASISTKRREEQWLMYEKYISGIVDDSKIQQLHAYRTWFIQDFTVLERRAVQEYENYWDMRVRDINVIPKHLIKPFTMEETVGMAWQMYSYLRSIGQPLFPEELGRMLLVIIETDWTTQDKLFEIQKLFGKLPKEIFLVLKSMLTHLCRLSVSMKQDPHLFRPLSNIFAGIMFRLTARQNSIYNEEKYMEQHPSAIQWSDDSLNAEVDSNDKSGLGSRDLEDEEDQGLYDYSGEGGGGDSENGDDLGSMAAPASVAATGALTSMTSGSKARVTPRSVITSKYSGTRASKMIEVENLWHGDGASTVGTSTKFEAPTIEESIAAVPGFKAEAVIRERTVFQPDLKNIEIPKESPFSPVNITDDEITFAEEEAFDTWVLKAMQDAANEYRKKKGLPPLEPTPPPASEAVDAGASQQQEPQQLVAGLPVEPGITPDNTPTTPALPDQGEKITTYTQSTPIVPEGFQDVEEFTGIRIEISETIEADIYLARTVPEVATTINEMDSLLAILDTPMHTMFASETFYIDRLPMVRKKSDVEEEVVVPENKNADEPDMKSGRVSFIDEIDFGKGDPDGFGWNLMTKRKLATELFVMEECQTANAALLELIIKNIDVLFEYNMYLTQERVGKMVSDEKRKADDQIRQENLARTKRAAI